jgi:hypothetical protein
MLFHQGNFKFKSSHLNLKNIPKLLLKGLLPIFLQT